MTIVSYTPFRYTGWRRWLRRLMRKPVESPTYEFEAIFGEPITDIKTGEVTYEFHATGPIRRVTDGR